MSTDKGSKNITEKERAHSVAFAHCRNITPVQWKKICDAFPTLEAAWNAPRETLEALGVRGKSIEQILEMRKRENPETLLSRIQKQNIQVLTVHDAEYPALLRTIYHPPPVLFMRGNMKDPDAFCFAVVGTRMVSAYGRQITPMLVHPLVRQNMTIVSGLARGVDTLAHTATIDTGGTTIAVLGSGLDDRAIYPPENRFLATRIIDTGGCLLSEYPPGTPPERHHFPERNRIIAGMSHGVLVVEAAEISGALITARLALEENREVFSVPGNALNRTAQGTNALIKKGAHPTTDAQDILDVFSFAALPQQKKDPAAHISPESTEGQVMALLSHEPVHIDTIIAALHDAALVTKTLTLLEIQGVIRDVGGMCYVICS